VAGTRLPTSEQSCPTPCPRPAHAPTARRPRTQSKRNWSSAASCVYLTPHRTRGAATKRPACTWDTGEHSNGAMGMGFSTPTRRLDANGNGSGVGCAGSARHRSRPRRTEMRRVYRQQFPNHARRPPALPLERPCPALAFSVLKAQNSSRLSQVFRTHGRPPLGERGALRLTGRDGPHVRSSDSESGNMGERGGPACKARGECLRQTLRGTAPHDERRRLVQQDVDT
jgi:hypothetical protein